MKNPTPRPFALLAHTCLLVLVIALFALSAQSAWAAGGYAAAVQADGPIAYWRFNDTPPTAANSGSLGAAANGTYNGGAVAGAQAPRPPAFVGFEAANTALQCDGLDDFVGTGSSLLNGRPVFTISGWMRRNADQNARTGLWGQNDIVEFGYIANQTLEVWTDNGLDIPNAIPNGEWAHLAIVSTGSGGTMTMYTNGVLAGSRTHTLPADNAFLFNIGGGGVFDGTGNFFNGQIDEVALFDKALTAVQIAAQYAGAQTPLAFTFDDCLLPAATTLFSGTDVGADAVPGTPANGRGYIGPGVGANCVLHLTDPVNSSFGAWRIPDQASGNNVDHLKVNWRSLIGGGGGGGADGYSFNWATDLPNPPTYGNPGEDGAGTGLSVTVDTFDNGGGEVGIEIRWQGARVAFTQVPKDNPGNGIYLRKSAFVDAEFEVETSGAARFNYDGNIVAAQLNGWTGIAGGSFMFGARTGNANDNHWIDDVLITAFPPSAPFITQQPANVTVRQGLSATFNVTVVGSSPLSYQWLRKLSTEAGFSPIPGANSASYTTPPTIFPDDDDSQFKVQVSNALGMRESQPAVLRVLSDVTPPTIVSSAGSGDFMHATVLFSEELEMGTAQDTFNYSMDGGIGVLAALLSADRKSVTLTTDLQTPDTVYTITVNSVADLAGLPVAPNSMTSYRTWTTGPCNGVLFEAYDTLPGGTGVAVSQLTSHPNFPNNPRDVALLTSLDSRQPNAYPDDTHENYGGRMRGVFFPRESGLHTFYLAADDNAELWLSTDLSPANKVLIARETVWSNTKEWTASAGASDVAAKKSAPIHLVGGQPYYIEALYKEGGGGDHCAVAVQTPIDMNPPMNGSGEIPAFLLGSPNAPAGFAGNITITAPPTDQTAVQCRSATFTVAASNPNDLFMCFQWQLNGTDIPGATKASYTTPPTQLSDEGALYTVNITLFGGASASASARLHVTADQTPPDCPTATGLSALNQVLLTFNEVLDPTSAETEANYSIAGVSIASASLDASKTKVTLTVSPLLPPGATVSVAVQGVADCSGNSVVACSASFQTWQLRYGGGRREFYFNIGGTAISDLRNNAKYPNSPDLVNFAEFLESPIDLQIADGASIADNYGTRVSGFLVPPVAGNYNFFVSADDNAEFWLSTDDSPANVVQLCREPQWATIRNWTDGDSGRRNGAAPENQSTTLFPGGIPLVANQLYYFEAVMKEGGGGDNLDVTWQTPAGGPQPAVPINANVGDANGAPGGTKPVPGRYLATLVPPGFDTTAPTVVSCKQLCPRSRLVVTFSEVVRGVDAENLANYSVPGATLTGASLRPDQRSVVLTASADIATGGTLTLSDIKDGVGNSIAAGTTVPIVTVEPFLATGLQNLIVIEAEHLGDVEAQPGMQPWLGLNSAVAINRPDWQGNLGATPVHPVGPGFSGDGFAEIILDGFRRFHANTQNLFDGFGARGDYCVNFPVAGTYFIWMRGSTFDGTYNSFHMGLDGVSAGDNVQRLGNRINNWGGNSTGWGWHNDAQSNPARIDVATAGLHTLNIWPREDGTRIDKIVLTTDAAFTLAGEQGPGPAESPQNDCPVATPSAITVVQDASVTFQLQASDADMDPLTYQTTQPPAHGVLVVAAATGAATYTPAPGYCGPDSFKFRVSDGGCNSQEATVSITVVCLNRCPTARITTIALCTELETNTFISPNGSNACFVLDGSLSSDPDGDTLTYAWFADGVPFGTGVRVTNCLDVDEHTIVLVVDDGRCVNSATNTVDVITGCEAVEDLIAKVNDSSLARANKRPLIATLRAACASLERLSFHSAVGQLGAFINKVHAQIAPANPDEAALFTRCAQSIIDSVECEESGGP